MTCGEKLVSFSVNKFSNVVMCKAFSHASKVFSHASKAFSHVCGVFNQRSVKGRCSVNGMFTIIQDWFPEIVVRKVASIIIKFPHMYGPHARSSLLPRSI